MSVMRKIDRELRIKFPDVKLECFDTTQKLRLIGGRCPYSGKVAPKHPRVECDRCGASGDPQGDDDDCCSKCDGFGAVSV